jgi:hypothetical protein
MIQFEEFKKIPRLFRDCVISEKIDGTNGQILIERIDDARAGDRLVGAEVAIVDRLAVYAGSRSRWITPGKQTDNHGFAGWVCANAEKLVEILGVGRHYGEWWGSRINRGYGLTNGEKRFSLFNTSKWQPVLTGLTLADKPFPKGLGVVPVLYEGPFLTREVEDQLFRLRTFGSQAVPGYMNPEGVVIYHVAAGNYFKATIEDDDQPKGLAREARQVALPGAGVRALQDAT